MCRGVGLVLNQFKASEPRLLRRNDQYSAQLPVSEQADIIRKLV